MREVAALAGVSHQTVSRVINGHPSIRPATRDRVLQVIEEVQYRPNSAARALATRRSNRIGVVVDSAIKFGPNATLRAVEESAREAGYSVSSVTVAEDRALSARSAVDHLLSQGIDALCIIAPRSSSVDLLRASAEGLPTLAVTSARDLSMLTASVDQLRGAELAVEHLLSLGHRDILHLAGPMDWLDARGRERGWRAALEAADIDPRPPIVGDWTADSGFSVARDSLDPIDFTAIFCANDQMALGVLHGLSVRGVRVPHDVSIVGFDDLPEARHFRPALTTVRQDFETLGQRTVEAIIAAIEGGHPPVRTVIEPELIVRESTTRARPR
jgi:DNA-binding LacI/PurR family transcriptional regulator